MINRWGASHKKSMFQTGYIESNYVGNESMDLDENGKPENSVTIKKKY